MIEEREEVNRFHLQSDGTSLVELADEIVESSQEGVRAPILHQMFVRMGASEALAIPSERRSMSAANIFDAFTSSRSSQVRAQLEQHFEVVGRPNTRLEQALREGDVMVRRGDGESAHIAVIANPNLKTVESVVNEGMTPEGFS